MSETMETSSSKKPRARKQKDSSQTEGSEEIKPKRHKREGRPLHQDLLDQFPLSGPKSKKKKTEVDKLEDKYEDLGDTWTEIRGYDLFVYHYKRRCASEPISNPWKYNLGKLVVPNVFVSKDLMNAIVANYDPDTKTVYDSHKNPFLPVTKEYIEWAFDLEGDCDYLIDTHKLTDEFSRLKSIYKGWRLPLHRPRDGKSLRVLEDEPPYDVSLFHDYLKYTYYSEGQVLGIQVPPLMNVPAMVMAADIQSQDVRPFDYATYLSKQLNHGLEKLKTDPNNVYFKHYSFLMHMLLYSGQEVGLWSDALQIKEYDKQGFRKPVQLWISIWDNSYTFSQYPCFEEHFVKPLCKILGYPYEHTLTPEVKKFLRPKDFGEEGAIDHNWGDWYAFKDCTRIRVYGFEGAPYNLPRTVPNRIAYLEIIRQLAASSKMHLSSHGKQSIMPGYLCFRDFMIRSTKSYDLVNAKMGYYNLSNGDPRRNFDPEGYISQAKISQKLRSYEHVPLLDDDLIRNMEENNSTKKLDTYDRVLKAYEWKRDRNRINLVVLEGIADPVAKAERMLAHQEEILDGVPLYVFRVQRQRGVGDVTLIAHLSPEPTQEFGYDEESVREEVPTEFDQVLDLEINSSYNNELILEPPEAEEIEDIRILVHEDFVSDQEFIHTPEFKIFLNKYKGKLLGHRAAGNISPENEEGLLKELQIEVESEVSTMTPSKGRKLLQEAGVIIYPGWDMNSAIKFDSFVREQDPAKEILPKEVDKIYTGSGYDPEQKVLLHWALYPKNKRPLPVDTKEAFGYLMTQRIGVTDPMVTAKLGVDVAQFNQAQMEQLIRERDTYKARYEKSEMEKQQWKEKALTQEKGEPSYDFEHEQRIVLALQDTTYWRLKAQKLERKLNEKNKQTEGKIHDLMSELIKHRFKAMMHYSIDFWNTYSGTMKAFNDHTRLTDRLKEKLEKKESLSPSDLVKGEELLREHQKLYKELMEDMKQLETDDTGGLPSLISTSDGSLLSLEQWTTELNKTFSQVLEDIKDEDYLLDNMKRITDKYNRQEYTMLRLTTNLIVYKDQEYIDHIGVVNLFLLTG